MIQDWLLYHYGGVAQLGEHLPCKQGVRSSNLLISTKDDLTRFVCFYKSMVGHSQRTPNLHECRFVM